jgi:hypothetical protein
VNKLDIIDIKLTAEQIETILVGLGMALSECSSSEGEAIFIAVEETIVKQVVASGVKVDFISSDRSSGGA